MLFVKIACSNDISGGYSDGVPPLPIPNREVKPDRADGTAHPRESRSPPFYVRDCVKTLVLIQSLSFSITTSRLCSDYRLCFALSLSYESFLSDLDLSASLSELH